MSTTSSPLASFRNPPVHETVVGVRFNALPLRVPHYGLLWEQYRGEFPNFDVHPPIGNQPELRGENIVMEIVQDPNAVRCWFVTADGCFLLQIQPDRFLMNWRKVTGNEQYPRYRAVIRDRFSRHFSKFREFVSAEGVGTIVPKIVEVTYINNIDNGHGWEAQKLLRNYFSLWSGRTNEEFLSDPAMINIAVKYEMPGDGKLTITMQPVMRMSDKARFLQLNLTAIVPVVDESLENVTPAADVGRDWIVRAFADVTGPELHEVWGREEVVNAGSK